MGDPPAIRKIISLAKKYRKQKCLPEAKQLLSYTRDHKLEPYHDTVLGNYLVPMLVDCGCLPDAQSVFDALPLPNEHSWCSLISGYIRHGDPRHALLLYDHMQHCSIRPSAYTHTALLKASGRLCNAERGCGIHSDIIKAGSDSDPFVGSTLVDMYGKCGLLAEARHVFDHLTARDAVAWTALMAGYAKHGLGEEAVRCFEGMQLEGVSLDGLVFASSLEDCDSSHRSSHVYVALLTGCIRLKNVEKGRILHADIIRRGSEKDLFVGNVLVDMYCKCDLLTEACNVLNKLPVRDTVTWNTLIAGFSDKGFGKDALLCYNNMQQEGVTPDSVTFACSLKACGILKDTQIVQQIHVTTIRRGLDREMYAGTSLMHAYIECSLLIEAQEVFDRLPVQDVPAWAALISGYAEHGHDEEVLDCFSKMQGKGLSADAVTVIHCLKACGNSGALETGRKLHSEIRKSGSERGVLVGNALLDMYGKCGSLREGQQVFENLSNPDVVSWSLMIKAYGENGEGSMVVRCYEDMLEQGVKPDSMTFTCLLSACSQGSLVIQGQKFFQLMKEEYKIEPTSEHCACMVDLLARSGQVYEAENFAIRMQCLSTMEVLGALLNACKVYGKIHMAQQCFQKLVQLNQEDAAPYLLTADMYVRSGRLIDANSIEEMRMKAKAKKKPALASIEINSNLSKFCVTDHESKDIPPILEILHVHIKIEGFVPSIDMVLRDYN